MRSLLRHLKEQEASSQRASRCCEGSSIVSSCGEASSSLEDVLLRGRTGQVNRLTHNAEWDARRDSRCELQIAQVRIGTAADSLASSQLTYRTTSSEQ